jgi:uncharacterized protein (DUF3820 family)
MLKVLTDESIMPWGIHKGKKLANVPAAYLLYLYDEKKVIWGEVFNYIKDNLDVLKAQVKQKQ